MRRKRMAALTLDSPLSLKITQHIPQQPRVVKEEIHGLIRVYKDGHVERPQIVPCVTCNVLTPELGVTSHDIVLDKFTGIWARFYVPNCKGNKLPLLVYFHGGGFCVGSAAWSCYHDFLARLAAKSGCIIMSVNYRLAPENPLPAAYDDGLKALTWLKQQATYSTSELWSRKCDFSNMFLAGDSAGANIAYNVAIRLNSSTLLKGIILIQPFFGGEIRTHSEKHMVQPPHSALTLETSDKYWQLSLPSGSNRDHPWCNPTVNGTIKMGAAKKSSTSVMVCISELDILKDRNLEFCNALAISGTKVECLISKGVGHAFQVLSMTQISQTRANEMISRIKTFINK
ncbi:putative carboxylesterase 6 [Heracleum sosnowskyi]|uniref:Carboxylesterase 6 n=1 Tax=Heracleum sosnowskyi TaxID=360622 RepID=A0AAD8IJK8_9APIA|nr:putative carboxylesterase 6 [Heracleum sosnowskyi]